MTGAGLGAALGLFGAAAGVTVRGSFPHAVVVALMGVVVLGAAGVIHGVILGGLIGGFLGAVRAALWPPRPDRPGAHGCTTLKEEAP
jgi:hypothetical protein